MLNYTSSTIAKTDSNSNKHFIFNASFGLKYIFTHPAYTYSKLTIETLEQGVKYVQSYKKRHQNEAIGVFNIWVGSG